jgi:hypothetical protein
MVVQNNADNERRKGKKVIHRKKERHVQPSEMISFKLGPKDFEGLDLYPSSVLEFSIGNNV